jgi:hypothetical protein
MSDFLGLFGDDFDPMDSDTPQDDFDPKITQAMHKTIMEDLQLGPYLREEIGLLGQRMDRMESALNRILERLQLPGLDGEHRSIITKSEPVATLPIVGGVEQVVCAEVSKTGQDAGGDSSLDSTYAVQLGTTFPEHAAGPYTYTSLDASKSQIRVLALQPASNSDDPIIANLETVDLDDNTGFLGYTALSYCWGAPVMDGAIVLAGHHFPVTASLESALRHLRSTNKAAVYSSVDQSTILPHYWIDQICINQADIDERGSAYCQYGGYKRLLTCDINLRPSISHETYLQKVFWGTRLARR